MSQVTVYNTTDTPLPLTDCVVYGKEERDVDSSDHLLTGLVDHGFLVVRKRDTNPRTKRPYTKSSESTQQSAPTPGEYQDSTDVTKGN